MTTMLDFVRAPFVIAAAAMIPTLLVVIGLAGFRMVIRRQATQEAVVRSLAEGVFIGGLIAILVIALRRNDFVESAINLQPFSGIVAAQNSGSGMSIALANLAGNLAIFVPFGVGVGWRFSKTGIPWSLLAIALVSVGIETMQWLLQVGRASDIDDVLMNVFGGAIGVAIGRAINRRQPIGGDAGRQIRAGDSDSGDVRTRPQQRPAGTS